MVDTDPDALRQLTYEQIVNNVTLQQRLATYFDEQLKEPFRRANLPGPAKTPAGPTPPNPPRCCASVCGRPAVLH